MDGKSLIMLDTNQIRLEEHMETDYSKCELKGFILNLIKYVVDSNLQEKILIVLPEIVIEEVLKSKKDNFESSKTKLKNKTDTIETQLKKFKNIENFNFPELNFPEIDIDYKEVFSQKFRDFLETKSFIQIISVTNKENLFDSILKRAINHDKPFSEVSDKGFKDALIWELFLGFERLNDFDYCYIVSENKTDFNSDLEDEFSTKKQKNLKVFYNMDDLQKELNLHYHLYEDFPDLMKVIKKEYFQSEVKEKIAESSDFQIKDINIINFCSGISKISNDDVDLLKDLKEQIGFEPEDEDLEFLSKINMIAKIKDEKNQIEIIYDSDTNEILTVNYFTQEEVELS
jgi:hypothetical protein